MKAQREHRVPLSQEVMRVLKAAKKLQSGDDVAVVFEGLRGKAMSNAGMSAMLKRIKRDDVTVHGFRSTFRDWCAEPIKPARLEPSVTDQLGGHCLAR